VPPLALKVCDPPVLTEADAGEIANVATGALTATEALLVFALLSPLEQYQSQSLTLSSCHKIQIFPSGKMLCTNCNGNNITIYNTDGSVYWNPPYTATAHTEVGTDLQGREVMIIDGERSSIPQLHAQTLGAVSHS